MKENKELNQQIRNVAVDKNGRPTIDIDERKSIYKSISEALKAIPITNRNVGLTISIYNGTKVIEYWWEKGIKDSDLVKKINTDDIPRIDAKLVDLQSQIDGINNIEFKIFDSLPELGDSSIIYVIPNTVSEEDDDFIEYFWIKSQQRYERFGGLNVDGGVTINNFYTFDSNVFTVNEDTDIKNVGLNSKKIAIGDKSIEFYERDLGLEDNERSIFITNYSRIVGNTSAHGGRIELNGTFAISGGTSKTFQCSLNPDGLTTSCTKSGVINTTTLLPQSLTIEKDTSKSVVTFDGIYHIENENNTFEADGTKLNANVQNINLISKESFNIIIDDVTSGIRGYIDEVYDDTIEIYTSDNKISVTNSKIELSLSGDSYIDLTYDNFNAKFNTLIYLNAPTTKVKKVLFEQSAGSDSYLEPYHERSYNNTYHGLRTESDIYIKDTNSYFVKSQTDYSLTSYGLNGIKHRNANRPTSLGYNVLTIGDGGIVTLGIVNELMINESFILLQQDANQLGAFLSINKTYNEISLEKGNNTNKHIRIDRNNNIELRNDNCKIIVSSNDITLHGINEEELIIDENGITSIGWFNFGNSLYGSIQGTNIGTYLKAKKQLRLGERYGDVGIKINQVYVVENNEEIADNGNVNIEFNLSGDNKAIITPNGITFTDGTNTYTKTWAQLLS